METKTSQTVISELVRKMRDLPSASEQDFDWEALTLLLDQDGVTPEAVLSLLTDSNED